MTALELSRTSNHLDIARRYAADPDSWPFAPRFDPHQRWYHRLANAAEHEVWLLTWLPGQGTDLHDHGGSAGAFVVVSGDLVEHSATADGGLTAARLGAGSARRFGLRHIHQITNVSSRPAVSVHVYGPALTSMTRYVRHDGALRVASVDRAGVAW
jgi:mannose-6-phosphate isomerase-like protein (cupin superfamily)